MPDSLPPTTVEPAVFTAIKAEEQAIHAYLDTLPLGTAAAAIGNWLSGLDDYFWRLLQLNAPAQWLNGQGFPATSQYLAAMTRDFASAQQKYVELYQRTAACQARWSGIWQNAAQFALNNIVQATQYRDAAFEQWMTGYFDVTENRCFDCHRFIGIPGGGYCLDCARRRGLIA